MEQTAGPRPRQRSASSIGDLTRGHRDLRYGPYTTLACWVAHSSHRNTSFSVTAEAWPSSTARRASSMQSLKVCR